MTFHITEHKFNLLTVKYQSRWAAEVIKLKIDKLKTKRPYKIKQRSRPKPFHKNSVVYMQEYTPLVPLVNF